MSEQELIEDPAFSTKPYKAFIENSLRYLLSKWKLLLLFAVIGMAIGLGYNWYKPIKYTARISFVVEESKAGGGNLMSALAGQFGFDVGSLSGTSGVLAGDNVLQLLKSTSLIKTALLTKYDSSRTLADVYAEVNGLKQKWEKKKKVGKWINFTAGKNFTRTEDSLFKRVVKRIILEDLSVLKPDRKLGFFELNVVMRDEQLSKLFCERLLSVTTDFYVNTKTKRLKSNVLRLQAKADSLAASLNRKTYSSAESDRLLLNANPAYSMPAVSAEISTRDKYVQSTIYAEIVKNLEISKTAMIQETPTVQVVDQPELPLNTNEQSWVIDLLMGALFAVLGAAVLLLLFKSGTSATSRR